MSASSKIVLLVSLVYSWLQLTLSECPAIEEVPVLFPNNPRFFNCGVQYQGPGDYNEIQACNTCPSQGFGSSNVPDGMIVSCYYAHYNLYPFRNVL